MRLLKIAVIALCASISFKASASVYDLTFESIEGPDLKMDQFKGKVTLIAVTATQCGNTMQLGPLQKLWERYRDQGLVVLGIPTNDFGLEPRDEKGIKEFCSVHYDVNFPMTSLSHIKGDDQHPFFKAVELDLGPKALPAWNFFKYLVNKEGKIIKRFPTSVKPNDRRIKDAIEKALGI